jgi:hypothetical protein
MGRRWWWGVVGSLGLAGSGLANEAVLTFAYPRGVAVDSFLVTYHVSTDPGEVLRGFRIAAAEVPTCAPATLAAVDEAADERRCTRPPACDPSPQRSADALGAGRLQLSGPG